MIIYQARNIVNNKIYIGKTINTLKKRKSGHYYNAFKKDSQTHFHRALRKYGKDNFKWSIIYKCKTEKELNETEIHFIDKFNAIEDGYNLTQGGTGFASGELNPNVKSPKFGKQNSFYGKHHTEETKEIIRQKNIGLAAGEKNYFYGKHLTGESNSFFGRHHTEETKEISSKYNSKIWLITHPDGKETIFRSLKKFCEKHSLNYSGVKSASRNNRSYKEGWMFRKIESNL